MWRRAFKWAASTFVGEVAQVFVWPAILPVGVAVMGWLQDVPWFYLAVGIMLAFAAGMMWLVQFDQWRYRNRVADKLILQRVTGNRNKDDAGRATEISMGVNLRNDAMFPIQCRMAEINTQFLDHYPPRREFETRNFIVPANDVRGFSDFNIEIPPQNKGTYTGYLQCRIEYGKNKRLGHELTIRQKVLLTFDEPGDLVWVQWFDQ